MSRFSNIVEIREENLCVTEKYISEGKEISENMNDIEIEYALVEDPLNIRRSASNESTLVLEYRNIFNKEKVLLHQGKEKHISILSDEFCEEDAFPYLLPTSNFGYNAPRDIPVSHSSYFNQRL